MAMKQASEDAYPMSNLPEMDVLWTSASSMLTQIYLKGVDTSVACSNAQKEAENLIDLMD